VLAQKKSEDALSTIVEYKNKDWTVIELLRFMAERIELLEKHQCKPKTACIFEGQKYLDEKYTPNEKPLPTEFWYYR
jgi:hypothetical protein